MLTSRPLLLTALIASSAVSLVVAGLCSYQSGCVFDGKQGFGDLAASEPYTIGALIAFVAAMTLLCLALSIRQRWSLTQFVPALAIAGILGIPIFELLSFEAAIYGTQQCHPT